MKYELEKYRGNGSRFTCPACHSRNSFARYKDENGEYLSDEIGRCNRESKCSYHKKPKDFFAENETSAAGQKRRFGKSKARATSSGAAAIKNGSPPNYEDAAAIKKPDCIERDILLRTLTGYEQNSLVRFLLKLFPDDTELVWQAVKDYLIGTTRDGKTIFWQIDRSRLVRTGKIIAYDRETGKRRKDIPPNWIHAELKRVGRLDQNFNLRQCFFGEHLLTNEKEKPAAIVEAEKTAVIASMCFPEFVWLAAGARQNLNSEKLNRLGSARKIILYPDADSFIVWRKIALQARVRGAAVNVSNLLETHATSEQKARGDDLADYLIHEQTRINRYNEFVDAHNASLEAA